MWDWLFRGIYSNSRILLKLETVLNLLWIKFSVSFNCDSNEYLFTLLVG